MSARAAGEPVDKPTNSNTVPAFLLQASGTLSGYAVISNGATPLNDVTISVMGGEQPPPPVPAPAPTTVAVDLDLSRTQVMGLTDTPTTKTALATGWVEPPLPLGCVTVDGRNSLLIARQRGATESQGTGNPRNAWGIRVTTRESVVEYPVRLDGIIIGPQPTAIINGVPCVRGDRAGGPFTLALIRRSGVVLEYDGVYFLLPENRQISVRIPKS
jgi:hypothetical protein